MKKYIISQIAKQYRAQGGIAKTVQVCHISYMFTYSYPKLVNTYIKSLSL